MAIALEKNRIGNPFVREAYAFKAMVAGTKKPEEFLTMPNIRPFLLAAAGMSEKSLAYLNNTDRTLIIQELIEKFLKPAGKDYVDEAVYRYLLTKGDAVGGSMRNRIGALGQEKLIRCILSCMNVQGIVYDWINGFQKSSTWNIKTDHDVDIEKDIKALHWKNSKGQDRVLGFNMNVSVVEKNVDLCLFDADIVNFDKGNIAKDNPLKAIMLGELKGGIDPAGADEHWKTGNSALERIRDAYKHKILTSFVGAAIEKSMAEEIFMQLKTGKLTNAANLTDYSQLTDFCNWLIEL